MLCSLHPQLLRETTDPTPSPSFDLWSILMEQKTTSTFKVRTWGTDPEGLCVAKPSRSVPQVSSQSEATFAVAMINRAVGDPVKQTLYAVLLLHQ